MYSHKEFLFVNTSGEALFCKTMLCALAEGFHRPVKQAKPQATTNKHESAFTCISHACGTLKNDQTTVTDFDSTVEFLFYLLFPHFTEA